LETQFFRKVVKLGDSLGVTIPSTTAEALGLKPGDTMKVTIEKAETQSVELESKE
jgi:antitoxin component of MazEF toxin-antitoxin module